MSREFMSTPKPMSRRALGKMAVGGTLGGALLGGSRSSSAAVPPQTPSRMPNPNLTLLCRNATTFTATKALDEAAFHQFLQRFVDAKLGVYLASGGSGERSCAVKRRTATRLQSRRAESGPGRHHRTLNRAQRKRR